MCVEGEWGRGGVRACVRVACARARVCVCVRACLCVCVGMCVGPACIFSCDLNCI